MDISFLLNGETVEITDPDPTITLLDWLRDKRGLNGTKEGCNEGDCGACTVAVTDSTGQTLALNSCILFLPQLHGKSLTTIEAIGQRRLHPVQDAMIKNHGAQCGFCTPGIIMSLYTAHCNGREDHANVLAGNLCRCTGYAPILRAAQEAMAHPQAPPPNPSITDGEITLSHSYLPANLDQLADWYEINPEATLIAGATDIGLWVTKDLQQLGPVAFLGRVPELRKITHAADGLTIGSMVTINAVLESLRDIHPEFAKMLLRFGSEQVRNAATIGGNIANGSPIGDAAPALIALDARLNLRCGTSRRTIPLESFFLGYGKQDRRAGELIESIHIPNQADTLHVAKISKRFDQDISALCGAFNITVSRGVVQKARIAFGGMAATPKRAFQTEAALLTQSWTKETIEAAQDALTKDFEPISDMRASAEYRMKVAQNLLTRVWLKSQTQDPVGLS